MPRRKPAASLRFVLIRPANALNIGAVARAMTNFGFDDLVAVDPYAKRWRYARSSRYGSDLLTKAKCLSLDEAIADCDLVLGTASAHDRLVNRKAITLPALGKLKGKRVAVLFGSERDGLCNDDFSRCHALLRIPTEADAPSMNLGQAAALVAYEFSRATLENSIMTPPIEAPTGEHLTGLVDAMMSAMKKGRVNPQLSEKVRRAKVRNGLMRWRLTAVDAKWLRGLFSKLAK